MNFLAHLYLAADCGESLIGSVLGDFVKGRLRGQYSADIERAIRSHRLIDSFSDSHPVTRRSRQRVSAQRRRFAGVMVDLCYDHFLACHWRRFHDQDLANFVSAAYRRLSTPGPDLPDQARRVIQAMISRDWLGSYQQVNQIGVALDRIAGRVRSGEKFLGALDEIRHHYAALETDFLEFFPALIDHNRRQ